MRTYGIVVGSLSVVISLCVLFVKHKLGERLLSLLQFNFLWNLAALVILTTGSDSPFLAANNGFFACWGGVVAAGILVRNNTPEEE